MITQVEIELTTTTKVVDPFYVDFLLMSTFRSLLHCVIWSPHTTPLISFFILLYLIVTLRYFLPQILEETKEKLEHMTALANQRDTEIGPLTPLDQPIDIITPRFQYIRWRWPPFANPYTSPIPLSLVFCCVGSLNKILRTTKEDLQQKNIALRQEKEITHKLTEDGKAYRFKIQVIDDDDLLGGPSVNISFVCGSYCTWLSPLFDVPLILLTFYFLVVSCISLGCLLSLIWLSLLLVVGGGFTVLQRSWAITKRWVVAQGIILRPYTLVILFLKRILFVLILFCSFIHTVISLSQGIQTLSLTLSDEYTMLTNVLTLYFSYFSLLGHTNGTRRTWSRNTDGFYHHWCQITHRRRQCWSTSWQQKTWSSCDSFGRHRWPG